MVCHSHSKCTILIFDKRKRFFIWIVQYFFENVLWNDWRKRCCFCLKLAKVIHHHRMHAKVAHIEDWLGCQVPTNEWGFLMCRIIELNIPFYMFFFQYPIYGALKTNLYKKPLVYLQSWGNFPLILSIQLRMNELLCEGRGNLCCSDTLFSIQAR